ncbi:site-2 protease family protein [Rugamonas sp. DEMB1]|uniref:site-2 protease family protein n=1 Tax=Rugamonas sp. DEMB1 TaxID=3039386 RepID=UPI00244B9566|nr:site-2 protease family protein [Rugamonas sp. DEMB1]WGG51781.1 site-2 protease family protein [Rugamonas sp. DEMB1]
MNIELVVRTITVYLIPVLFAISLHEAAHGYVARYFGDPTAANEGRLSLNPLRHIDPFGTVLLPLLLYFTIQIPFGYAKPVPVDYNRLRNPRKQMAWVAAAGPAANFAMGLGWMLLLMLLGGRLGRDNFFVQMAVAGLSVNAAMCVFNLIPLPPLDGGRIVTGLLPLRLARPYASIERYGMFVFIGLIMAMQFGLLDGVLSAGVAFVVHLFGLIVMPISLLLN